MTPAEREALPPLDINEDDVKNALFTTGAWPVLACRERQLLAKMSLISTLELTLSNAARGWISVEQELPPIESVPEEYIIAFTHKMSPNVGIITSTGYWYGPNRDWEDGFGERLNKIDITHWRPFPAPPPEPLPEEKK